MFHKFNGQWPRWEHFHHYMDNVRCTYSLTVQIDITKIQSILKSNGIKAYPAQIYMLAAVVNRFPEFRTGVSEKGEPGYWETSSPSYTIFNSGRKTFSSIWTTYEQKFFNFYSACINDIHRYRNEAVFAPKQPEPPNIFSISSIPWIDFTSFNLNVYTDGTHLAPIFTIGKYIEQNHTLLMPLAMQLHHSACDGYHSGQFVEALQDMAQEPYHWL